MVNLRATVGTPVVAMVNAMQAALGGGHHAALRLRASAAKAQAQAQHAQVAVQAVDDLAAMPNPRAKTPIWVRTAATVCRPVAALARRANPIPCEPA